MRGSVVFVLRIWPADVPQAAANTLGFGVRFVAPIRGAADMSGAEQIEMRSASNSGRYQHIEQNQLQKGHCPVPAPNAVNRPQCHDDYVDAKQEKPWQSRVLYSLQSHQARMLEND